ncbi:MAG: CRISPR-associated endonuclease Cas2 [Kiloniellales bacterium]|nr:CRISPR-associated endonuclease Cas2 [Kiloniellales bacterium]
MFRTLSGYRIMWMMVMFDLPVLTEAERKAATRFRHFLLDHGFEMSQFSVYLRWCSGKEQVERHAKEIQDNLPPAGRVNVLTFTDKQYANMICFTGGARGPKPENPGQLALF